MRTTKVIIAIAAVSTCIVIGTAISKGQATTNSPATNAPAATNKLWSAKSTDSNHWEFELDGTGRWASFGPAVTTASNRTYHVTITTNEPEATITKAESDQRVVDAFSRGFDAGVEANEFTKYKDGLATAKARARQNLQPPARQ